MIDLWLAVGRFEVGGFGGCVSYKAVAPVYLSVCIIDMSRIDTRTTEYQDHTPQLGRGTRGCHTKGPRPAGPDSCWNVGIEARVRALARGCARSAARPTPVKITP